jgi:BirA family biotin operon repressor/biotin-[acetyl-CoA-carboxylase] ligase
MIDPAAVLRGLRPRRIPSRLVCLDAVASTNDLAWEQARAGAPEGWTVSAESQAAGRGRFGRAWHSPPGLALAVSVLLRPTLPPERLPLLTAAAAVAAAEAAGPWTRIRWPNDVVARGRKLAGVIVEGRDTGAFVLGCGMNVNPLEADFPEELKGAATSLRIESGREHDRADALKRFLERLDVRYDEALRGDPALGAAWKEKSALLGKRVRVTEGGVEHGGEVVDLDVLEGLMVRLEGGVRRFRLEHVERLVEEGKPIEESHPRC